MAKTETIARMATERLSAALRCTATPGGNCVCEDCPFWTTEDVPEDLKERFGKDEWGCCDVDAVAMAAAEKLEQLEKQIDRMLEQMHGDCGVCKHKEAIGAPCVGCLTSRRNRPAWEYEGIPEVKNR